MKRMSRTISTLALLLMSLGAVPSANAVGLLGFGPRPGHSTNSVAPSYGAGCPPGFRTRTGWRSSPVLMSNPAASRRVRRTRSGCRRIRGSTRHLPVAFPGNFPEELFYFDSTPCELPCGGVYCDLHRGPGDWLPGCPRRTRLACRPGCRGGSLPAPAVYYVFIGFNPTTAPESYRNPPPCGFSRHFQAHDPLGRLEFNLTDPWTIFRPGNPEVRNRQFNNTIPNVNIRATSSPYQTRAP